MTIKAGHIALVILLLLISACASIPSTPKASNDKPPVELHVTAEEGVLRCIGGLTDAYRPQMRPLYVYVTPALNRTGTGREYAPTELPGEFTGMLRAAVLAINPRRVMLTQNASAADLILEGEIQTFDRGIETYTKSGDIGFSNRSIDASASAAKEIGFSSITVSLLAYIWSPAESNGNRVPITPAKRLQQSARTIVRYMTNDKKFGVGLLGLSVGVSEQTYLVDGRQETIRLMAQKLSGVVLSRFLLVPFHRCSSGANEDNDMKENRNESLKALSDTELTKRIQELLAMHKKAPRRLSGVLDHGMASELSSHLPIAENGAALLRMTPEARREYLVNVYGALYNRLPIDVPAMEKLDEAMKGMIDKGRLAIRLQRSAVVDIDGERIQGPTCGLLYQDLDVGDHSVLVMPTTAGESGTALRVTINKDDVTPLVIASPSPSTACKPGVTRQQKK